MQAVRTEEQPERLVRHAYGRCTAVSRGSPRDEDFAHAVGDRLHLQGGAGHLLQHLLGPQALALAPQLAEQVAGLPGGEPAVAELLPQVRAELRLESP